MYCTAMNNNEAPMLSQAMNGLSDHSTQAPFHRRAQSEIISLKHMNGDLSPLEPSLSDEDEGEGQGSEEDDPFSLFIDMEKVDQPYSDDSPTDSVTLSIPQADPVPNAIPISETVEDTFNSPLTALPRDPLLGNTFSKEKATWFLSKDNDRLKENGVFTLKEKDPSKENGVLAIAMKEEYPLNENGMFTMKEKDPCKENGLHMLKLKGVVTDPIEEKYPIIEYDPIRDARKGKGPVISVGPRHRHTQSLDETTNGSGFDKKLTGLGFDVGLGSAKLMDAGMSASDAKKAMANVRLAELAMTDPKKAKRIWANRQSAARSKERKVKYIGELERRVDSLRHESTTLTAQLSFLQRDTNGLTVENNELRLRVQAMEQQVGLQDSLNEALRAEVQRLKIVTGQVPLPANFNMNPPFGTPQNPNFFNNNPSCTSPLPMNPHLLTNQQIASFRFLDQHQPISAPQPVQPINMMQPQAQVTTARVQNGAAEGRFNSYFN